MAPRPIQIRRASLEDAALLFSWRNDERVRCRSHDPSPLQYPAHLAWLQQNLSNPNECLLLAVAAHGPAACVRFSIADPCAHVSIYTDPARQGERWGTSALAAATRWLRRERPAVQRIEADVLSDNAISHALFRAAGYAPLWTRYQAWLHNGDEGRLDV